MSELKIFAADAAEPTIATQDTAEIARHLSAAGAEFAHFALKVDPPDAEATQDEVIESQRELLNELMRSHAFVTIDVLNITSDSGDMRKLEQQLAVEHWHPQQEARLFLVGRATFFLRVQSNVYAVTCGPGDFLSLPEKVNHWSELEDRSHLCAVRLYSSVAGWQSIPAVRQREKMPQAEC